MSDFVYQGQELDLFARARNWKAYWRSHVEPFLSGDVLEVGAGSGVNTGFFAKGPGAGSAWNPMGPWPALCSARSRRERVPDAAKW